MKHTQKPVQAFVTASLCFVIAIFTLQSQGVLAVECEGKPYGYPGCPTKSPSSAPATPPPNCGNNVVEDDEGEECDMGRFNGTRQCSVNCTLLYCGDGKVTASIGEECEPEYEEVYVKDPQTGELKVEKQFKSQECGNYCTPPSDCDASGKNCRGGCKQKFLSECAGSASSEALKAAAPTSSAPGSAAPPADAGSSSVNLLQALRCGNGVIDPGEQCDDGNQVPTDGCTSSCQLSRCGDGIVQYGEQCDDGNQLHGDACGNTCQVARCGDGIVQVGEQCDDGNQINTDGCSISCLLGRCGDGVVQGGEACDDGNQVNGDSCTNACRPPSCGDGIVQYGEQCDDGNPVNTDACSNNCQHAICGDRIVQLGEQCDDGNEINTDSCTSACRKSSCGDGVVQLGEECDDGNQINTDTCSNACKNARCGNGVKEASEECDDGNQLNADGCTNSCRLPICGNGVREEGEECDEGSRNSATKPDSCRDDCQVAHCGDHVVDEGEECDGSDDCSQDCIVAGTGTVLAPISRHPVLATAIATVLGLATIFGLLFRKHISNSLAHARGRERSIDDIPLDEIEMPWHSWS
ncbi:DUF4215 domain-containing protein [Candidatus Peregrinibacteria bacterium]|nr:DUF4215 domain-containing protein [Candidatus Peregrinibacteria bacterium]